MHALQVVHTATGSARGCRQCGVQAMHDTAGSAWQKQCTVMQTEHGTGTSRAEDRHCTVPQASMVLQVVLGAKGGTQGRCYRQCLVL